MSGTNFKFNSSQDFQLAAIRSVVSLFEGQPKNALALTTTLNWGLSEANHALLDVSQFSEVGAVGNNLVVDRELVLANLQAVQDAKRA